MGKTKRRDVLECISHELELQVYKDEVRALENMTFHHHDDFFIEIDGEEYRFIHEDYIWDIYVEEIKEVTRDCYIEKKLPDWVEVDWEKTAKNVYHSDGYGHHFSRYDGSEYESTIDGEFYYIFRIG